MELPAQSCPRASFKGHVQGCISPGACLGPGSRQRPVCDFPQHCLLSRHRGLQPCLGACRRQFSLVTTRSWAEPCRHLGQGPSSSPPHSHSVVGVGLASAPLGVGPYTWARNPTWSGLSQGRPVSLATRYPRALGGVWAVGGQPIMGGLRATRKGFCYLEGPVDTYLSLHRSAGKTL